MGEATHTVVAQAFARRSPAEVELWHTDAEVLIRPDDLVPDDAGEISATVKDKAFKGAEIMYTLELPTGTRLLSLFPSHYDHHLGDTVRVRLEAEHLICFAA